ncbi:MULTISPECIES: hypothetical protein [Clostridium]|uniref:Uncharacterized protein n=1 Tax=Clostridium frigoriphilum TaxID=443253 RepID=A0ABU7UUL6_9CLOT|nr:hypothetical protein [Clostridium sp. DSM 17811]MBU3101919.1 hypothetical protein [Clostridium sp. DSM 17811]
MESTRLWQMDNEEIVKTHKIIATENAIKKEKLLGLFEFEVKRYKDKNSKREQLEISAKVQGEDYGKIKANLMNLESEIVAFRSHGVALGRTKFVELSKFIVDKYYYFKPEETESIDYEVTGDIADEVLEMLCRYIYNDDEIEVKVIEGRTIGELKLYHIPLKDFNKELKDSKFKNYNYTDIKEGLSKKHYTHSNKGKFDYVVSENGLKTKMVSIHESIAEPILKKFGTIE